MKHSEEKLKNFQKYLKRAKISAFAVTDNSSINFLTDFYFAGQGDSYLLITPTKAYCFTKELYIIDLKKKTPYLTLVNSLNPADIVAKARAIKAKNAAFDPQMIGYIIGNILKKEGFKEEPGFILNTRQVKTEQEIKTMRKACQISAKAYDEFKKYLKVGITELDAAKILEGIMEKLGGKGLAFTTIMAFGENTANPHHITSSRKLKKNEPVLLDYGCRYGGYCSDITRTLWFGDKPSKEFTKMFDIVKAAHDNAFKNVRPGMTGIQGDALCRDYLEKAGGYAKYFIHSTGHSLGCEIHESPYLSKVSKDVLQESNVFSIEPGVYFEGRFGIRYENTVCLTKDGAKNLTKK